MSAQSKLKKNHAKYNNNNYHDTIIIIKILKEVKLLPVDHVGHVDFIKLITEAIANNYILLSKELVHRHVLRKKIHGNNNEVLIQAIKSRNGYIINHLINLPNVKATLAENDNDVLRKAISFKNAFAAESLLKVSAVISSAHSNQNELISCHRA
jgi:hypothetical protein